MSPIIMLEKNTEKIHVSTPFRVDIRLRDVLSHRACQWHLPSNNQSI